MEMTKDNLIHEIERLQKANVRLKALLQSKGIPLTKTDHDYRGCPEDGRCSVCGKFYYQHNK